MQWVVFKMRSTPYYSGAAYLLGQIDPTEDSNEAFVVSNPVRINEVLSQQGQVSTRFMADDLFSSSAKVSLPIASIEYFRMLDETNAVDMRIIAEHANQMSQLSAQRAGIVIPKAGFSPNGLQPNQ